MEILPKNPKIPGDLSRALFVAINSKSSLYKAFLFQMTLMSGKK